MTLHRIVVAYDGSRSAHQALQLAEAIAERFHSAVDVLTVLPPAFEGSDPYLDRLIPVGPSGTSFDSLVESLRPRLLEKGAASVEGILLRGDPLDTLIAWLETHPRDLVVVGSRGLSRSRRILLGSVSAGLIERAPCPVLVVRASKTAGRP